MELGTHEGGFTGYSFDITQRLRATNVLAVRLDNRPGIATIPGIAAKGGPEARYDWWTYGGLVRDAAGNLYGNTYYGGSSNACDYGCGVAFEVTPAGKESTAQFYW